MKCVSGRGQPPAKNKGFCWKKGRASFLCSPFENRRTYLGTVEVGLGPVNWVDTRGKIETLSRGINLGRPSKSKIGRHLFK